MAAANLPGFADRALNQKKTPRLRQVTYRSTSAAMRPGGRRDFHYALRLERGVRQRNVRVEARTRSRQHIRGQRVPCDIGFRIVEGFPIIDQPILQRLAGRAEVGARGIRGVIGRGYRLCRISEIGSRGRRRSSMKPLWVIPLLADKLRTQNRAVVFIDETAVRLKRHKLLAEHGKGERIGAFVAAGNSHWPAFEEQS